MINNHSRPRKIHHSIQSVNVEIPDAETIKLDGEEVTLSELKEILAELNSEKDLMINFITRDNVPSDLIRSIEEVIRKSGATRVNYHSTKNTR